jgi:subtilisin family serine protease
MRSSVPSSSVPSSSEAFAPGLLGIRYDRTKFKAARDRVTSAEFEAGGRMVAEHDYPRTGEVTHVLAVDPRNLDRASAKLRALPGVKSVSRIGRRWPTTVTKPYFTDDPYFVGFPPSAAPYYETRTIPGQWDQHAIGLESAWGYSQANNGSGIVNARALGSAAISIAIIDTGEDLTHPELGNGKVVHTGCFVSNPTTGLQSRGPFVTDYNGHGTDVAGIAGEDVNNALGFAGTGGNVSLFAYRVYPTPDNSCLNDTGNDPQCSALSSDIASAIDDAVSKGASVINLSLGGSCPDDGIEGGAVANAIANNVVVVAAAGNNGSAHLDAPACDPGVIAAGASGLADGVRNGTNDNPSGEYVAGYSQSGSGAWGIVAPGGDPNCPATGTCPDLDFLHWISNIYTSTPLNANFAGDCSPDFDSATGRTDCRILIAGTSMATPHIAGAAALIRSVNRSAYTTPAAIFTLLCDTATNINDARQGCGRLNIYKAMATALGDPKPPRAGSR